MAFGKGWEGMFFFLYAATNGTQRSTLLRILCTLLVLKLHHDFCLQNEDTNGARRQACHLVMINQTFSGKVKG